MLIFSELVHVWSIIECVNRFILLDGMGLIYLQIAVTFLFKHHHHLGDKYLRSSQCTTTRHLHSVIRRLAFAMSSVYFGRPANAYASGSWPPFENLSLTAITCSWRDVAPQLPLRLIYFTYNINTSKFCALKLPATLIII